MAFNKAISALVEAGLIERMLTVGEVAAIEIVSLIKHYTGDRHFVDLVREDQVDELLVSLILKTTGPCSAEEIANRLDVLTHMNAREMIRYALDLSHFPCGGRVIAQNTPRKVRENAVFDWKWGSG